MKHICLILGLCVVLSGCILCRRSCQSVSAQESDMLAVSNDQYIDSMVIIPEDSDHISDCQNAIYEWSRDMAACFPKGNYYKLQPGLLDIVNQIFTNDDFRKSMDFETRLDAYPQLLRERIDLKKCNEIDTFKYNWKNDTIICINLWARDVVCLDCRAGDCNLISSQDTIFAYGYQPVVDIKRFKIYMNPEAKSIYYGILRRWDKEGLDSICEYDQVICDGSVHGLSRWVIKDGTLLDLKYLRCEDISSHKIEWAKRKR